MVINFLYKWGPIAAGYGRGVQGVKKAAEAAFSECERLQSGLRTRGLMAGDPVVVFQPFPDALRIAYAAPFTP